MGAYDMRKPKDWQEFERAACVLVRCVLSDPHAQANGRGGQKQAGVDICGTRFSDGALVGVQCKKRFRARITEKQLRKELGAALKFKPQIDEFVLATTAERDARILETARLLTLEMSTSQRPVKVAVWGWEDIEESAQEHVAAQKAFDQTYNPYVENMHRDISARIDAMGATLTAPSILLALSPPTITCGAPAKTSPLIRQWLAEAGEDLAGDFVKQLGALPVYGDDAKTDREMLDVMCSSFVTLGYALVGADGEFVEIENPRALNARVTDAIHKHVGIVGTLFRPRLDGQQPMVWRLGGADSPGVEGLRADDAALLRPDMDCWRIYDVGLFYTAQVYAEDFMAWNRHFPLECGATNKMRTARQSR